MDAVEVYVLNPRGGRYEPIDPKDLIKDYPSGDTRGILHDKRQDAFYKGTLFFTTDDSGRPQVFVKEN